MIRNMVMIKLKPDADRTVAAELMAAFVKLDCPGTVSYTTGFDAGLRDGNWDMGIVADFADVDSYRGYDADAEHNRLRARIAPMAEQIARLQFEV